jgi:diguanylate cyclase (GGDEF)-like protein
MEQSGTNVGYVLLDEFGQLIAADEFMCSWLGDRTLAELLPDLVIRGDATARQHMTLYPVGAEPTFSAIECRRLAGQGMTTLLLRIEIRGCSLEIPETYRDAVTGLPDRRALAMHRATLLRDANGTFPHAVLFLDLDNFKQINDSHGHAIGDQVLAILVERWRKSLRGHDLLVRYGGDEFVVLVAGVSSRADVQPIIDRLRVVTNTPIKIGEHLLEINLSIGVATAKDSTTPLEELLESADRAMYAAKRHAE